MCEAPCGSKGRAGAAARGTARGSRGLRASASSEFHAPPPTVCAGWSPFLPARIHPPPSLLLRLHRSGLLLGQQRESQAESRTGLEGRRGECLGCQCLPAWTESAWIFRVCVHFSFLFLHRDQCKRTANMSTAVGGQGRGWDLGSGQISNAHTGTSPL